MPHIEMTMDGEVIPSVTQFLGVVDKPWAWAWYKSSVEKNGWAGWQANLKTTELGGQIGTDVHALVEQGLHARLGEEAPAPARVSPESSWPLVEEIGALFLNWFDAQGVEIVEMEYHFKDEKLRYHGTCDLIIRRKVSDAWVYEIWDWKTSNQSSDDHPLQLWAYARIWNAQHPASEQIVTGLIVRVNKKLKTKKVQTEPYLELWKYEEEVLARRTSWDYVNRRGRWKGL